MIIYCRKFIQFYSLVADKTVPQRIVLQLPEANILALSDVTCYSQFFPRRLVHTRSNPDAELSGLVLTYYGEFDANLLSRVQHWKHIETTFKFTKKPSGGAKLNFDSCVVKASQNKSSRRRHTCALQASLIFPNVNVLIAIRRLIIFFIWISTKKFFMT